MCRYRRTQRGSIRRNAWKRIICCKYFSLLKRYRGLNAFEHTLFHDLLSTLDGEFPSDPYKDDVVVKASHGPELALAQNLPFYFHRDYQEKGLIKALKTGLPTANIVQGLSGSGTTTMLQHLARTARQMFGRVDTSCETDRVVIVSDYGAAEGRKNPTPTQVLRNLAKQMKSALNVDDDVPASLENVRAALVYVQLCHARSRSCARVHRCVTFGR